MDCIWPLPQVSDFRRELQDRPRQWWWCPHVPLHPLRWCECAWTGQLRGSAVTSALPPESL